MKRIAIIFILVTCSLSGIFSQSPESADVVLLLDSSSAMVPLYDELNDYIANVFLREFLRPGDTFHLILFSDRPRLDISRRVVSRMDAEIILGRIFLRDLPVPQTDIPTALAFAEAHISSLLARPGRAVLVSASDPADFSGLFAETQTRLARLNTTLEYVQLRPGDRRAAIREPVREAAVPAPVPVIVQPEEPPPIVLPPEPELIEEPAEIPMVLPEPEFAEIFEPEAEPESAEAAPRSPLAALPLIPVFILLFLALLVLLFFALGVMRKKKNLSAAQTSLMFVNLFVEDQNTFIGRRNIHALKQGCSYTVG